MEKEDVLKKLEKRKEKLEEQLEEIEVLVSALSEQTTL
jgi:hypothetical protein